MVFYSFYFILSLLMFWHIICFYTDKITKTLIFNLKFFINFYTTQDFFIMVTSNTDTTYSASSLFNQINKANGLNSDGTKVSKETDAEELQNQFLTLLTAQLQNQDPLNPLENTELTSQLAQINTVSGIAGISEKITALMSALNNNQGIQAASIIGKNILTNGNQITLSSYTDESGNTSSAAYGGIKLESNADKVVVKITNGSTEVRSIDLGAKNAGIVSFAWDGIDNYGNLRTDGNYKFTVEATQQDSGVIATTMQYSPVYAVSRNSTGDFVLDLGDKGTIKLDEVQQII